MDPAALLAWHIAMGVDEAVDDTPVDRFTAEIQSLAPKAAPARAATTAKNTGPTPVAARPAVPALGAGPEEAQKVASACTSLEELREALEAFDGGLLKRSAKHTVFSDGTVGAPLMVAGDLPEAEDDQQGRAFAGAAGELLDRMLAAIGYSRNENAYLTNLLPWRPLGSSKPDEAVIALCKPFLEKHIELAKPKVLLLMGGAPGKALFDTRDSISRQRGRWQAYKTGELEIASISTYQPAYLLKQPHMKAAAWKDLQALREKLSS